MTDKDTLGIRNFLNRHVQKPSNDNQKAVAISQMKHVYHLKRGLKLIVTIYEELCHETTINIV